MAAEKGARWRAQTLLHDKNTFATIAVLEIEASVSWYMF
jgi:hypothetical protein